MDTTTTPLERQEGLVIVSKVCPRQPEAFHGSSASGPPDARQPPTLGANLMAGTGKMVRRPTGSGAPAGLGRTGVADRDTALNAVPLKQHAAERSDEVPDRKHPRFLHTKMRLQVEVERRREMKGEFLATVPQSCFRAFRVGLDCIQMVTACPGHNKGTSTNTLQPA